MSFSPNSAPRTIAFFPPELVSGGTQRHLLEVLKHIDRSRFTPLVISAKSGGPLGAQIRAADVELIDLHLGSSMMSWDFVRCVRKPRPSCERAEWGSSNISNGGLG